MPIPKEEFAAWFDWAKAKFAEAKSYPLIDAKVHNFDLLSDAYNQMTDNDATREHLESRLAHAHDEISTRFVILNYYYELVRFDSDLKEEYVSHLRQQFGRDLTFFVGLRPVEDCTGMDEISWEITNACAVRDWTRVQALYMRLRSTEEIALGTFHAAYGHFLFRAAFGDYDPEDPDDDSEALSQWSVLIVNRTPESYLEDLTFELSMLTLGFAKHFSLPKGRSEELMRDAKNELEKARDMLPEFRPGLRSALARCYMARGEYRQAAAEYKALADVSLDQMAWTGLKMPELRSTVWARVAAALELAQDDSELRRFLEHWISLRPEELGPREHLAKLEARCGNYEAAFRYLSEANSMNPAHDQDWKATLLVELGTRAANEERVAEIVRGNIQRNWSGPRF
jgi:tetratricopeptide (TPR) repeat protein